MQPAKKATTVLPHHHNTVCLLELTSSASSILRHADSERRSAPRDKAQALASKNARTYLCIPQLTLRCRHNDHTLAVGNRFHIGEIGSRH